MKSIVSIISLIMSDIIAIFISIFMAVSFRKILNLFGDFPIINYFYLMFFSVYVTLIIIFAYLGIYTKRFDFWHESKLIVKSCFLAFIILFAGLALGQNAEYYSRSTLILIFIFCSFIIPASKLITKRLLFKYGAWQKPAKVISESNKFKHNIFEDYYLGYVKSSGYEHRVIFVDGENIEEHKLNIIIESNIRNSKEIIFTPVLRGYDFSSSNIYNIFDARTNIFTIENKLLNKYNKFLKVSLDYILVIFSSFLWIPIILVISILIKKEDCNGKIFFKQKRLGLNGKEFICYKFRTMYSDQSFMKQWIIDNPEEKAHYNKYRKYINDPRVTKIGSFLRKTSLDELPQLFNVLKGDMSLIGPRPYIVEEKEFMGEKVSLILNIKPGLTGLWQVSGRSDVDFENRVEMDAWYMKNWSIWNDIVILLKTLHVVFSKNGAY